MKKYKYTEEIICYKPLFGLLYCKISLRFADLSCTILSLIIPLYATESDFYQNLLRSIAAEMEKVKKNILRLSSSGFKSACDFCSFKIIANADAQINLLSFLYYAMVRDALSKL